MASGVSEVKEKTHSLVLLAMAGTLAAAPLASAQEASHGTLPEIQVIGRALSDAGGPATLGFGFSAQPDANGLQKPEDVLVEAGLAAWDASGSLGLATTVQSRGFALNPQSATGLSTGKILLNGHPDVGRRFVRDPAQSDVLPQSITNPSSATAGTAITVNWVMKNQGLGAAASSSTVVRISSSTASAGATNLATVATGAIPAGGSVNQSATVTAPSAAGTYYVWVIADNGSVLSQSNVVNDQVRGATSLKVL